ncbi:hypothetical protein [uncultured Jannaschia sp.]|uniref:hypothetical protein n=1 Tax=uncultured Jannaschia sp. TaxID=293347 RepID=UPI0034124CC4
MDDTTTTVYRHRWTIAGIGGAIAFVLFWLSIGWGFLGALILGVVVFVLLLVVIGMIGTDEPEAQGSSFTATAPPVSSTDDRTGMAGGSTVPPGPAGGGAGAGGAATGATSDAVTGTPAGEGAGTAERRREDEIAAANAEMSDPTHETPPVVPTSPASKQAADAAGGSVAPDAEATPTPEPAPSSDPVAMPPAEPMPEDEPEDRTLSPDGDPSGEDPAAEAVADAAGEGRKPETLDAPRTGGADDLKRIKGVGPKLEALCNRLGIWHFDQIAGWTDEEVAWVDQHLEGFKGRVRRDDWVAQARALDGGRSGGTSPS